MILPLLEAKADATTKETNMNYVWLLMTDNHWVVRRVSDCHAAETTATLALESGAATLAVLQEPMGESEGLQNIRSADMGGWIAIQQIKGGGLV